MLGGAAFLCGIAMETIAGNLATLYLGRVIAGVGVGIMSATVPLYISETAETYIRGRLIAVYQLMITIGIFIATCVNSLIIVYYGAAKGDSEWRLAFGLQFIPCCLMMLALLFLPFSPRWLIYMGRSVEGLAVIAKLRGKPEESEAVQNEYKEIVKSVDEEREIGEGSWVQLFTDPVVRYRTFLGITLQFFQQWTGINIILYFGASLFAALGFSDTMSIIGFPLINSAVNLLATIPGMWLIERAGRKFLLIVGGFGMGVSLILVCIFGQIGANNNSLDRLGIGAIVFVLVFVIFFGATWGPVVWVYQSEIFPLRYRAKGTSAATVSNWVWNAVVSKIAPLILAKINYYTYIIWAGWCVVMAIFTIFFVPETKGLTLEQIEVLFGAADDKKMELTTASPAVGEKAV
jgi:sugar porter (SP) family MFS transporter